MIAIAKHDTPPMTAEQFLSSPVDLGPGKHVLIDGVIYSMAPASPTHALIQAELARLIGNHLRERNVPYRVMTEAGMQPRVRAKTNVRIPDLTITCGPPPGPKDRLVEAPLIIIEVLSPSNSDMTEASIQACASIPSVMEMLIVDSTRVFAERWHREASGAWPREPETITAGGKVMLASISLELGLADIYADTHLSVTPE